MSGLPTRPPKFVSPSRIARYYFQECPRFLRYSSTPKELRKEEGVPPAPHDFRPVTNAILETGYAWEEQVIEEHLGDRVHIADGDGRPTPIRDRVLDQATTRELLTSIQPGEWLYQATLSIPPGFYERYGIDPGVVQFADCRPDLIECLKDEEGVLRLRVTDVKASTGVKLSHRIQSTMYSLILEHVLADWGVTDRTVDGFGGVWLSQAHEPEAFDIRGMRPPLESFLEHELQPLMKRPADEADWHVYYRCEWCPYFEHCRDEMRRTNDVSRIPYLSSYAKRFLRRLDPPVRTVKELEQLATDPDRRTVLADCASLRGHADRVAAQAKALRTGKIGVTGGSSIAMPAGEHVQIILTIQNEPVSGQVYAYGIYAHGLKPVLGENPKPMTGIASDSRPETSEQLERDLIRAIDDLLTAVHEYNTDHDDWKEQRTLQVFVFDSYESNLLTDVLMRRVLDPEVSEEALRIFMHFQQPELLQAEDHPSSEVFFPVVVLSGALRSLFALPVEVSYRFRDAVELFRGEKGFEYRPNDYLSFELSNQVRSDAIYAIWTKGEDYAERIERELRQRLWATSSLISGMRDALKTSGHPLFAWPAKFFLPDPYDYQHTVLSRLGFLARYESVLDYVSTRTARMAPLEEQLRSGDTLRITYRGDDRFEVDPRHRDVDIHEGGFKNRILVEDTDDGRRARLTYNDYSNRSRVWVPKSVPLALAAVTSVESTIERPNIAVHLDLKPSADMPELSNGQTYLLGPRMTDYNTDHVIAALQDVDADPAPPFVELLSDPASFARPMKPSKSIRAAALRLATVHGMTASQLEAFEGIIDRRLQIVWGPPGTGKTHFLALAILCLAEAHRAAGVRYRILVTAFTHAAIDNCLRKITQLNGALGVVAGDLPVGKLGAKRLSDMDAVTVLTDKGWTWPTGDVAVVGGTVWATRKGAENVTADLVVIDEGSQLKVPESVLAVTRVSESGRLLIAGDDRQLPPIVSGNYPDPGENEPLLHRSIFECLRLQDQEEQFTSSLLENFRMNATLCRYPADQIYVPEYRSASPEIAERSLSLADGDPDDLIEALVDPAYPLVVGVLEGVQATAENVVEAELVARAAGVLRSRLHDGDSRFGDGMRADAAFWKHGLFIVSPHHAQINAVRRALADVREWESAPFVDTVDKMQGQECEAVIATYGVSDVEYAMNEKEFIYSLNRLNVSITRARAKTIVFLPRPLIEPPIAAFEDDRISDGIAFMQGLVRFAEHEGDSETFVLEGGVRLHMHRIVASD